MQKDQLIGAITNRWSDTTELVQKVEIDFHFVVNGPLKGDLCSFAKLKFAEIIVVESRSGFPDWLVSALFP
jgi:hypothetical protein